MINNPNELIPVFPHGLVVAGADQAPFILFKDSGKALSFPLWLPYNPIKMQHNISVANFFRAPGSLSQDILRYFNHEVQSCIFTEVKTGGVQWAKVVLKPLILPDSEKPKKTSKSSKRSNEAESELGLKTINMLAYEAFSLGTLNPKMLYYATDEFIKSTREEEITDVHHMDFNKEKTMRKHGQKYLM